VNGRIVVSGVLAFIAASCASPRSAPVMTQPHALDARLDQLTITVQHLGHTIDSLRAENDSLRREHAELYSALQRLREIDTRGRPRGF